jgi:hypothetical protein
VNLSVAAVLVGAATPEDAAVIAAEGRMLFPQAGGTLEVVLVDPEADAFDIETTHAVKVKAKDKTKP